MYLSKKSRNVAVATGVALPVMAVFLAPAEAALNAGVATGFTALQVDSLALVDLAWPVVIAVTVAFIILGLFKRAASKAV
jgi:hypothetical protein